MKTIIKNPVVQIIVFAIVVTLLLVTFKSLGMDLSDKFNRG